MSISPAPEVYTCQYTGATMTLTPGTMEGANVGGIYFFRKRIKGTYRTLDGDARTVPTTWRSAAYTLSSGGTREFIFNASNERANAHYASIPISAQCLLTQVSDVLLVSKSFCYSGTVVKFLCEETPFWEVFPTRDTLAGQKKKNAFTKLYWELDIKQVPFHPKLKLLLDT